MFKSNAQLFNLYNTVAVLLCLIGISGCSPKRADNNWNKTVTTVSSGIVSIQMDVPVSFEGKWNSSTYASGFVVDAERGIIFARTKAGVQKLTKQLKEEGFSVDALEGDMMQKERDKVMRAFKKENIQVLVSTDVAARGIDVQNLGFVLHHQLPEKLEYYTHRSGRTARAGKKGVSLVLILGNEKNNIKEAERTLQIQFSEINI